MPFTFSHPAIVLPLTKYSGRYFSITGLIIGSLTPDFEYFFRMKIQSNISHKIGGLFYFDLPIGFLLAFLFHNFIRDTLYYNLPLALRSRLETFKTFNWNDYFKKSFIVVIISVLIGAASHLFWDSFTHIHGYSVQIFSTLRETVKIAGYDMPLYKLLQHLSTLIGGFSIVSAFYNLTKREVSKQKISLKYWTTVLTITISVVITRLAFSTEKNIIGLLIVTLVSAFFLALIITPTLTRKRI